MEAAPSVTGPRLQCDQQLVFYRVLHQAVVAAWIAPEGEAPPIKSEVMPVTAHCTLSRAQGLGTVPAAILAYAMVALLVHSVTRGVVLAPVVAGAVGSRHTVGTIPKEAGRALTATHTLFPTRPLLSLGYC